MIEGWERRLAEHIAEAQNKPFQWGEHDCALWCGEWIMKATGRDITGDWKGLYQTEAELLALLEERGLSTPQDIADSLLIQKSLPFASRGDILLHPCGTLGVCAGTYGAFVTERGVIFERTMRCQKAWGIE